MEDIPIEFSQESGLHIIENGPLDAAVDIIAVHGLAANPVYTWIKKVPTSDIKRASDIYPNVKPRLDEEYTDVLWIKHLLPVKVPEARILKYNYASSYLVDAPKESLRSIASRLVYLIHNLRKEDPRAAQRPIIFVGHSFGGIVIMDALVYAYHHYDTTYKQITLNTCGAVFLGTPFRGSKASSWGVMLADCAAALGIQSEYRLLKTLLEDSEVLDRLMDDFIAMNQALSVMAERFPMRFICFYETKETQLGKFGLGFRTLVVDKISATFGYDSRSLPSDHSDMNKFSSLKDEKFILVSGALEELVKWSYKFLLRKPVEGTANDELVSHHLPSSAENFTGREDYLEKMRLHFEVDNLRPNSASQKRKIFVLYGLGGSGKTQLALKFAELYCDCFAEIYFIDSSSNELLEDKLVNIAKQMKIGSTVQEALQWLDTRARQRSWLLIFDNADDPSLDLGRYLPKAGYLIITTRNRDCRVYSQGNINVEALPPNDAIDLLFKASMLDRQYNNSNGQSIMMESASELDLSGQYKSASELAKELGYLPLAITQAGAYIRQNSNFSNYLQLFTKRRKQILRCHNLNAQNKDYALSVYATWDLSYNKLEDSTKYFLRMCGVLHHESIPKSMLRRGIIELLKRERKHPQELVEWGENFAQWENTLAQWEDTVRAYWTTDNELDDLKFNDTFAQLTSYSFINTIGEGHDIFSIHSLVQFWIQDSLKDSERLAIRIGMKILLCLSVSYYKSSSQEYYYWRKLLPHLLVLSDAGDIGPEEASMAAFLYKENGLWSKAEEKYLQVFQARKKILGDEHPNTLTSINDLAFIYSKQGKWIQAKVLGEQVIESEKRILGEEHPNTLTNINNLAVTYSNQSKWTQAEALEERVLELSKRILGKEHPETLTSINNLALTYLEQGRWIQAEILHKQVLESSKRFLGEEHPDTLTSIKNLAATYAKQGKLVQAEALGKQVLESMKRILGKEHPNTLTSISNLASIYANQGKLAQVEALEEQILESSKRIFGEGKLAQAEALEEQILESRERILGEEHRASKNIAESSQQKN